ncbi:MAG: alpha-1,2-fucosyltransferase [Ruminiclostridium sp.]
MKDKIFIIGSLSGIEKAFLYEEIETEGFIGWINTLSIMDAPNESHFHFIDSINDVSITRLDIKKNLKNILSHSPDTYETMTANCQRGRDVKFKNSSDYILINNIMLFAKMFVESNTLYSDYWPRNEFINYIINKNPEQIQFPFPEKFNWKFYYDKFIDTILSEYDGKNIFLLRTSLSSWYFNGEFNSFDKMCIEKRRFMEYVDDYFISKTNCVVLDDYECCIPLENRVCSCPYGLRSPKSAYDVAKSVSQHIRGGIKKDAEIENNQFLNTIKQKTNLLFKEKFSGDIALLKKNGSVRISKDTSDGFRQVYEKLSPFVDYKNRITISDCYNFKDEYPQLELEEKTFNFDLLLEYSKYIKCDINDIICIYELYQKYGSYYDFKEIVKNICGSDSAPIEKFRRLFKRNTDFLKDYPYISKSLKNAEIVNYILPISESYSLLLDFNSDTPVSLISTSINDEISFEEVQNNQMICPINSIDYLCCSLKFYINRAKSGNGNKPIKIIFNSISEFINTLGYIDYTDIIANEKFVISLKGEEVSESGYTAKTDLSFLFNEKNKVFMICSGLGDQMNYYFFSKYIEEKNNIIPYYDDIRLFKNNEHSGLMVDKVINEDISERLLSNIFSKKLIEKYCDKYTMADSLYEEGMDDLTAFSIGNSNFIKKANTLVYSSQKQNYTNVEKYCQNADYFAAWIRSEPLKYDIRKFIAFSEDTNEQNVRILEEMNNSDSVAIHCRRGDFVSVGWDADMDFYTESMEKLLNINDYPNKKFFVFSDDIPWCRNNIDKLGFSLVENPDITFVDHNKDENSYRDMQLMSNAKIIIGSNSGFVRNAALISKKCEIFMCYNNIIMDEFKRMGRTNKYDVGPYKKNYITNYNSRSPKK